MISELLLEEYRLLDEHRAFVVMPPRTLLQFSGSDGRKFVHNFCTADVKAMRDGGVKEAFVLNSRGKILAFGHLIAASEILWFSSAIATNASPLREHFEKYIIRENVQITDVSAQFATVFVSGPNVRIAPELIIGLLPGNAANFKFEGNPVTAANAEFAGFGILLLVNQDNLHSVCDSMIQQDLTPCSIAALEMRRMESGTPWYGLEIDDTNLPQEIRRDDTAISFTKGCYLGQETVAKIDAIGHVNKFLVGLKLVGIQRPPNGEPLFVGPDKVGDIKTSAFSPKLTSWLALAYIKSQLAEEGTTVSVGSQEAIIVKLPLE